MCAVSQGSMCLHRELPDDLKELLASVSADKKKRKKKPAKKESGEGAEIVATEST
jgi:hypothetical protein